MCGLCSYPHPLLLFFLNDDDVVLAWKDYGLLGAVYLATFLISSVVTNNAAAALVFPIAIDAAERAGVDVVLMSFCVMLGASDFMTPYGYQ
jgi:di/tricarboxylate transporter